MADTVDSYTLHSGQRRHSLRLIGESDGTGESGVVKVDVSAFTTPTGETATYTKIDRITFSVSGHNYVRLHWDADTDDTIALLRGEGEFDWQSVGGFVDPQSTGNTGDILLTTDGAVDGAKYEIDIYFRVAA